MIVFTTRNRARIGRGCSLVGNAAMFFNDFPRFVKLYLHTSICDRQVRAEFLEEVRLFGSIFGRR